MTELETSVYFRNPESLTSKRTSAQKSQSSANVANVGATNYMSIYKRYANSMTELSQYENTSYAELKIPMRSPNRPIHGKEISKYTSSDQTSELSISSSFEDRSDVSSSSSVFSSSAESLLSPIGDIAEKDKKVKYSSKLSNDNDLFDDSDFELDNVEIMKVDKVVQIVTAYSDTCTTKLLKLSLREN